jgi:hypothetical protein
MSFLYAYCSKETGDKSVLVRSLTFDKRTYFSVPHNLSSLEQHPFISKHGGASLANLNRSLSGYRHVRIPLAEAGDYLDQNGNFSINELQLTHSTAINPIQNNVFDASCSTITSNDNNREEPIHENLLISHIYRDAGVLNDQIVESNDNSSFIRLDHIYHDHLSKSNNKSKQKW